MVKALLRFPTVTMLVPVKIMVSLLSLGVSNIAHRDHAWLLNVKLSAHTATKRVKGSILNFR